MDDENLDNTLDRINARLDEALSGRRRFSLGACYRAMDPGTAKQIDMAAQRAHWGEDEWAEKCRERAGYGGLDA